MRPCTYIHTHIVQSDINSTRKCRCMCTLRRYILNNIIENKVNKHDDCVFVFVGRRRHHHDIALAFAFALTNVTHVLYVRIHIRMKICKEREENLYGFHVSCFSYIYMSRLLYKHNNIYCLLFFFFVYNIKTTCRT